MAHADGQALGRLAARRLVELGQPVDAGLTDPEIDEVERVFGFTFAVEHRSFLQASLPIGDGFPDWRDVGGDALADQVRWPVDGVLFDVAHNDFWYPHWGQRPDEVSDAVVLAATRLEAVPRMVPVYRHRCLPAGIDGHPVLSIMQTDVICYGADLADYVEHEWGGRRPAACAVTAPFWRDL